MFTTQLPSSLGDDKMADQQQSHDDDGQPARKRRRYCTHVVSVVVIDSYNV